MAFRPTETAALLGAAAVICAGIGALHGLWIGDGIVPAFLVGCALGSAGSQSEPGRLRTALTGLAPIFALGAVVFSMVLAARTGSSIVGLLAAAGAGALLVRALRPQVPSAALLLVAGALAPVLMAGLVPRVGLLALGLGGAGLFALGSRAPRDVQEGGLAAGFALGGGVPLLLLAAAPAFGADPLWLACGVGGALFGLGLVTARPSLVVAPVALPLMLAGGGELLLRAPGGVLQAAALGAGPSLLGQVLPLAATFGVCALVVGSAGGVGKGSGRGLALGAVLWVGLATVLEPPVALRMAAALAGLGLLPILVSQRSLGLRLSAAAGAALGMGSLLLAPVNTDLAAAAAWRSYGDQAELGRLERQLREPTTDWAGGPAGTSAALSAHKERLLHHGLSTVVDAESAGADAFFGHSVALFDQPAARALLSGLGTGRVADAMRRSTSGTIRIHEPAAGLPELVALRGAWNRDVLADPAVRLTRVDPLLGGGQVPAILIDLPPRWAPGAAWAWSAHRLARLESHLMAPGRAAIRLPLLDLSGPALGRYLRTVGERFPQSTVWLDPVGAGNLVVLITSAPLPLDGGAVFRAWSRRTLAEDARAAALSGPADLLERVLGDSVSLGVAGGSRRRDGIAEAVLAGSRARSVREPLALASLGPHSRAPLDLIDLASVPDAERVALEQRLTQAATSRVDYLELLAAYQAGRGEDVMAVAARLARNSANPSRDLRAFIQPWLQRGRALQAQGLLERAQAEFAVAQQFSPTDPIANLKLADIARLLGDLEAAERHYQMVLEADPQNLEASFGLGALRTLQGRLADAVDILEAAEKLHPGSAPLLVNLAWTHVQLAVGSDANVGEHLARARVLYQRAAALAPRMPQPHAGLATVFERLNDFDRALPAVERALTLEPSCVYRGQRGSYLYQAGRLEEARGELQKALLDCPSHIETLNALAALEADDGNVEAARELWEQALRITPDFAAARENLARLEAAGAPPPR